MSVGTDGYAYRDARTLSHSDARTDGMEKQVLDLNNSVAS